MKKDLGFTLIEVMIVVAVIGVLSAIAVPAYSEYVRKARRADAAATLMEASQYMQRFYSVNDRYDKKKSGVAVSLPSDLQVSPKGVVGNNIYYNISFLGAVTPNSYELQAVPAGSMAGDKCGSLILASTGQKKISATAVSVNDCWK